MGAWSTSERADPARTVTSSPAATLPWHSRAVPGVLADLAVDIERGLDRDEVTRRRATYGLNRLDETRRRGPVRMLLAQFSDFMVLVLLGAAVVAGVVGEPQDSIAIAVIVVLNATLGFAQEYRAERALTALAALAAPSARVRRDGATATVAATALVPGDIVLLEAGNAVPADLRLIEVAQLRVDEAALTGESHPVDKTAEPVAGDDLPLGDRVDLAFKGTMVTYGRGKGVVIATGMATELGRIARLLRDADEVKTPLQHRLDRLGRRLALAVLGLCAVIFGAGVLRGEPPLLMFMTALSLAVAAIPEALPAVVTVSLALGARTMARRNALLNRLPAVETLGSVTYICADKTGTLTQNRMRVEAAFVDRRRVSTGAQIATAGEAGALLLQAMALSNDAEREHDGSVGGDPTEVALFVAAAEAGMEKAALTATQPRVAELTFSSERARMTTLHRHGDGAIAFTKGAPEAVLLGCIDALSAAGPVPLDSASVLAVATEMAHDGLRVLAVAMRRFDHLPGDPSPSTVETGQTFLGLLGLLDPPRPEARAAVALCQSAGIWVVMITGDHPATAAAVARTLGISVSGDTIVTGAALTAQPAKEFAAHVRDVRVYARVAPAQKIQIVEALQRHGEFVAMTGDGVNDAPALRRADIGVAMGRGGTDVARQAAHMVLLDDNFATIVSAVAEGRRIYDNIRKFVRYVLTGNSGEIWTLFLAPLVLLPTPLLPIHILWVNLVTDGLPGLALAMEPAEEGVMRRPPRPPRESVFAGGLWQHVTWVGLLMGGVTLATQAWALRTTPAHWQSMTFTVLTLSQMGHLLAIRSERGPSWRLGLRSNPHLLVAVGLTFLLQMATLYVPALTSVFKTTPLSAVELASCLGASAVVWAGVELEKWMIRHGWLYRE